MSAGVFFTFPGFLEVGACISKLPSAAMTIVMIKFLSSTGEFALNSMSFQNPVQSDSSALSALLFFTWAGVYFKILSISWCCTPCGSVT